MLDSTIQTVSVDIGVPRPVRVYDCPRPKARESRLDEISIATLSDNLLSKGKWGDVEIFECI
jgi:hypothetical protein